MFCWLEYNIHLHWWKMVTVLLVQEIKNTCEQISSPNWIFFVTWPFVRRSSNIIYIKVIRFGCCCLLGDVDATCKVTVAVTPYIQRERKKMDPLDPQGNGADKDGTFTNTKGHEVRDVKGNGFSLPLWYLFTDQDYLFRLGGAFVWSVNVSLTTPTTPERSVLNIT